ncbi:MAG: hypothetical protein A2V52_00775 [Actinobacteria bacterium RBG_19FT_COMBO_54_7]|nr:MAG: hypothetical protein A2V52_00775 [Actinobacteria bacterium RBG_19FT_COMBO_54_7]
MKTSSKMGLVIAVCLFVVAITAGTALAVRGSGESGTGGCEELMNLRGKRAACTGGGTEAVRGRRGRQGAASGVLDGVAEELGMAPKDLLSELKGGKTLAEIANEKGVDLNTLIDKILEPVKTRLSKMVENGGITQDQADERLSRITEEVTDWASNGGIMPGHCDRSGNSSPENMGPEILNETPPGADMV